MGIRKIREIGDEVLTKQCKEVTKMSLRTKILIGDMLDTMYERNLVYFKELTMYIIAGKKKLEQVRGYGRGTCGSSGGSLKKDRGHRCGGRPHHPDQS